MIYLTGFADEAATGIDDQIRITKALGWRNIESRNIDGVNIHDLSDDAFEEVAGKLSDADVRVNCFGSSIANWATSITDPFENDLAKTRRAIERMEMLGSGLIRIMSYAFPKAGEAVMEAERFRRLNEMVKMFRDSGLTPVHENCMNYGGMSWQHTLRLLENVPGLKLVFDTGNPVFNKDRSKPEPYPYQSSWEFYSHVKEHIEYVHVKDVQVDRRTGDCVYKFPGEGDGDVVRILADLVKGGYSGGISIEPHLAVVFHDAGDKKADLQKCEDSYVEYGQRLMKMLAGIGASVEK